MTAADSSDSAWSPLVVEVESPALAPLLKSSVWSLLVVEVQSPSSRPFSRWVGIVEVKTLFMFGSVWFCPYEPTIVLSGCLPELSSMA